jgi:hypothetical protein
VIAVRYMVFVKMREDVGPAPEALHRAMGEEMGAAFAAGSMIDAGGLGGSAQSTEIRLAGGEVITTNGPWTEAVEVAGGTRSWRRARTRRPSRARGA